MNKNNKIIINAHDKFFKSAMTDLRVAKDFLIGHLPTDIKSVIDLQQLKLEPRSFINDIRKETTVDMLYKTKVISNKNEEVEDVFIYLLIEHQSTADKLMPFRLLKYICNIMDGYIKDTNNLSLPLVYPMVLYHSAQPYPYSTDIKDLIKGSRDLIDRYFLKPFQLIDLGQIEDKDIKQRTWSGVMEFALKHIYARDMLIFVKEIVDIMRQVDGNGGRNYIFLVLQYMLERGEFKDKEKFYEIINDDISYELGEKVMTLGEQLRHEGRQEGRHEGRQEGRHEGVQESKLKIAEKLMLKDYDLYEIAEITDLTIDQLQTIKNKKLEIIQ